MQSVPIPQLEDVMTPTAVSAWPPGPAWWAIAVIFFIIIAVLIMYLRKRSQHLRAKKEAIALANSDDVLTLHQLLKRLCKHYYGDHISALSGAPWARTLSQLSALQFGEDELTAIYRPQYDNSELREKLRIAINQFKTKEVLDV